MVQAVIKEVAEVAVKNGVEVAKKGMDIDFSGANTFDSMNLNAHNALLAMAQDSNVDPEMKKFLLEQAKEIRNEQRMHADLHEEKQRGHNLDIVEMVICPLSGILPYLVYKGCELIGQKKPVHEHSENIVQLRPEMAS